MKDGLRHRRSSLLFLELSAIAAGFLSSPLSAYCLLFALEFEFWRSEKLEFIPSSRSIKDFLSAKNPLEISKLSAIFEAPETRLYKLKREQTLN